MLSARLRNIRSLEICSRELCTVWMGMAGSPGGGGGGTQILNGYPLPNSHAELRRSTQNLEAVNSFKGKNGGGQL